MSTIITITIAAAVTVYLIWKQRSMRAEIRELKSGFYALINPGSPLVRRSDMPALTGETEMTETLVERVNELSVHRILQEDLLSLSGKLHHVDALLALGRFTSGAAALAVNARSNAVNVLAYRSGLYKNHYDNIRTVAAVSHEVDTALDMLRSEIAQYQLAFEQLERAVAKVRAAEKSHPFASQLVDAKMTLTQAEDLLEQKLYDQALATAESAFWLGVACTGSC